MLAVLAVLALTALAAVISGNVYMAPHHDAWGFLLVTLGGVITIWGLRLAWDLLMAPLDRLHESALHEVASHRAKVHRDQLQQRYPRSLFRHLDAYQCVKCGHHALAPSVEQAFCPLCGGREMIPRVISRHQLFRDGREIRHQLWWQGAETDPEGLALAMRRDDTQDLNQELYRAHLAESQGEWT